MALTEEQKAEFTELITTTLGTALPAALDPIKKEFGRMANGAATTAAKAAVKAIEDKVSALPDAEGLATLIETKIGEKVQAKAAPSEDEAARAAEKAREDKMQKQIDALTKKLQTEADEKVAMQTKQQKAEERASLATALEKAGIKPSLRPAAIALLTERGAVARDAEGAIVFKSRDKAGAEEVTTIEEGVTKWITGDEGKEYLPPKDTGGSGDPTRARGGKGGEGVKAGMYDPQEAMRALSRRGG